MALLDILVYPDPRLRKKALPVELLNNKIQHLIRDMAETMYAAPGMGLAAVQVGAAERVIVVDSSRQDEQPQLLQLINPELVWASDELATYEEGCLSLPEFYAEMTRPAAVEIRYLDLEGENRTRKTEGVQATCVQHEMDHLDGILFVDHLSPVRRSIILRKLAKAKKQALQPT